MARPPVIVTRPAAAGRQLHRCLSLAGWPVLWLPAFDIGGAPDVAALRRTLADLASYQLVVFVSPHAVAAAAPLIEGSWPDTTALGVVGKATEESALAEIAGAATAGRIAPSANAAPGSEGLWAAWIASGLQAHRVLIVRAQGGRDWLAETFAQAGAAVDLLAAYTRNAHCVQPDERAQLSRLIDGESAPVVVFSSSEAVAALDGQLAGLADADRWVRSGVALATHPRIAERLRTAGYERIVTTEADDLAVLAKLESLPLAS